MFHVRNLDKIEIRDNGDIVIADKDISAARVGGTKNYVTGEELGDFIYDLHGEWVGGKIKKVGEVYKIVERKGDKLVLRRETDEKIIQDLPVM